MTSATQTAHGFQWARLGRPAAYLLGIAIPAAVFTALHSAQQGVKPSKSRATPTTPADSS